MESRRRAVKQVDIAEARAKKYPEWIALVITHDPDGHDNVMPAGWCMFAACPTGRSR